MSSVVDVMIIEDDLKIAQLHQRYIEQLDGFQVVGIATTQADALLQIEVLQPHLIILDVYLPDGSGLDILTFLRSDKHRCDVILVTAARDVETLQQAMRGGVIDYLLKPVIFSRLELALKKYQEQKLQLHNLSDVDQRLVDKMLQAHSNEPLQVRLPKGIDSVTLDKIRGLFSQALSLTAEDAGAQIGASRTTARRYLEYLISTGELVADLHYGSVGRPERTYRRVASLR
ncbi:two-component system response regulator [Vibrio panuliri]|uniref:Transcriptional regulatory protein n=1 Tax=Vibrio panuliri TaxID=1381081 RepID=A0A1Q9HF74_9VIBR|nr:response regulator [Vibrio panuliri]OLQ88300.1 two-component system response regulator [Vibrio panuliri]